MWSALLEFLGAIFGELFFGWLERRSPWIFWTLTLGLLATLAFVVYLNR